jgi:hypothetical protein
MSDPTITTNHDTDLISKLEFFKFRAFKTIAIMQKTIGINIVSELYLNDPGKKLLYNFTLSGYPLAIWQAYNHNTNRTIEKLSKINPIINLPLPVK